MPPAIGTFDNTHPADDWLHWMADVGGDPHSFVCNLAFEDDTRRRGRSLVAIEFSLPESDETRGLGSETDRDTTRDAAERVLGALQRKTGRDPDAVAMTTGRLRRTAYIATRETRDDREALERSIRESAGDAFPIEIKYYFWGQYDQWLYPSRNDLRWAEAAEMRDERERQGDNVAAERPVDHHAWFSTRKQAGAYAQAVGEHGAFDALVHRAPLPATRRLPWGVSFRVRHAMDTNTIFAMHARFEDLAESMAGAYEGYGAEIIPADPT
ncbi:MAG: DUF695 domain-containing protein [Planctomycetota bacterium]